MAGTTPKFFTGAMAKVILTKPDGSNVVLAYAADVSYNVDVITIPVDTLGRYEPASIEPVAYGVSGSFSVVRYTGYAAQEANAPGAAADGNSSAKMGIDSHTNPGKFDTTKTFDMEIRQKYEDAASGSYGIFKVKDCHVTRKGGSLNKRGLLIENYSFVGVLAGDTVEDTGELRVSPSTFI